MAAGGLQQAAAGVVDGQLGEVVGVEADLDDAAMGDRLVMRGYWLPCSLILPYLVTVRPFAPQEQGVEGLQIGDPAVVGGQPVAETCIGLVEVDGLWPVAEWTRTLYSRSIQAQKAEFSSSRVRIPATWASRWNWFLMILLSGGLDFPLAIALIGRVAHSFDL